MTAALAQGSPPARPPALRPPDIVMRLDRLGAMHPTRLSFARAMLRRVEHEGWRVTRTVWAMDQEGFGHAVYRVDTPRRLYSLVAFSRGLAPEQRTDRVIAEAWDTSYVLYDGVPDDDAIARLATEVPLQEAGRFTETELVLSRANKSVRAFDAVVADLAEGRQPDAAMLDEVGYLMRTTAVYGNGKFGIADRDALAGRPEFAGPFRAEMLTVWLIRAFTVDLAEHCAAELAPSRAARLAPDLRRRLGVGNSTGLGMAPFLVRHPTLLHAWMVARETALARVLALPSVDALAWEAFVRLLDKARAEVAGWRTADPIQAVRVAGLRADLVRLAAFVAALEPEARSWEDIYRWAEAHLGPEAQDYAVGLLIEPHGALVDGLADQMSVDERLGTHIDGTMSCAALRGAIQESYAWALATDYAAPAAQARFWYVSAEKLEPRLGERWDETGAEREQPLAFGRDVAALYGVLGSVPGSTPVARFLLDNPHQRHVVRRVQIATRFPYAEIRGNLIDAAMRPIDLLRCKLAFFGATRFDPRSDRWLRISLFGDAPFPDDLIRPPGPGHRDVLSPEDLSVSFNEVEALGAKALRGAGAEWGAAEDLARATRWMAERGLDWSAPLTRLLGDARGLDRLGPLFEVADRLPGARPGDAWRLETVEPVWAVALLAGALPGGPLTLDIALDDTLVRLLPDGGASAPTPWAGFEARGPRPIRIAAAAPLPPLSYGIVPAHGRRPVSRAAWDILETSAARTYVAASAQSRSTGAGGERVDAD